MRSTVILVASWIGAQTAMAGDSQPDAAVPWFIGQWQIDLSEGVCMGVRLKNQQLADFGLGKASARWDAATGSWQPMPPGPCTVTFWEHTRYTQSGNDLAIRTSISSSPLVYRLDSQAQIVRTPDGSQMTRVAGPAPALQGADAPTAGDPGTYELPGRVTVSPPEGWSYEASEDRIVVAFGKREMVIFHPVARSQMGAKMLEVGHSMDGVYTFARADVSRRFGEVDAQVFDSETIRMSDGYTGARLFAIEACCGQSLVGMAVAAGTSEATLWSRIDLLLGSMRRSEQPVDPRCEEQGELLRAAMTTLTSSSYGETFRRKLVAGAGALQGELARRVGPDGVTDTDQAWADCATDAFAAADDVVKGIWQMNRGGYGSEWVSVGRFVYDQEQMLARISSPGEVCAAWVRGQLGDEVLSPVDRYLAVRTRLDSLICPNEPGPSSPTP